MKKLQKLADDYRQKFQMLHLLASEVDKAETALMNEISIQKNKIDKFAPLKVYEEIRKSWISDDEKKKLHLDSKNLLICSNTSA